jgi:23S rRNA pseudouridine1911/1915/1917 synthase
VSEPGRLEVPPALAGVRLDRALAAHLDLPRNQIQAWIRAGAVQLDGAPARKPSELLRAGAELAWTPPPAADVGLVPEPGELAVLHEDAALIALDKPAGLVVHPGAGRRSGTLVHRLLARYPELAGVGGPGRPGIVHRLDRGTSGVMLVARTAASYRELVRAFAERAVDKRYLALVWGAPARPAGSIEEPIGRHRRERQRMTVSATGKPAHTGWRRIAVAGPLALLEFRLYTGRTHQIRVHARHLGHPLVGDPVYGGGRSAAGAAGRAAAALDRPALHAWRLRLRHPVTGAPLALEAPVPADLRALWHAASGAAWPSESSLPQ